MEGMLNRDETEDDSVSRPPHSSCKYSSQATMLRHKTGGSVASYKVDSYVDEDSIPKHRFFKNARDGIQVSNAVKAHVLNDFRPESPLVTKPTFDFDRQAPKYTIFEAMAGPNENRFVPFNDMPENNSKHTNRGMMDMGILEGREKETLYNLGPEEFLPDYNVHADDMRKNLRLGAIAFNRMSSRKPNVNKVFYKT
jgi:hypothetical protein